MSRFQLPLDIEDHIRLGNGLKQVDLEVRFMLSRLPPRTAVGRDSDVLLTALAELRSTLDAMLTALVPQERDPRGLAQQIYIGHEQIRKRQHSPGERDSDVFAIWASDSDPRIMCDCMIRRQRFPDDL